MSVTIQSSASSCDVPDRGRAALADVGFPCMCLGLALAAFVAVAVGIACGQDEEAAPSETPTDKEIRQLIADLEGSQFAVRRRASRALVRAGQRALPLVVEAAHSELSETRARAFDVLLTLSQSADAYTAAATLAVVQRLAKSENQVVAGRAGRILRYPQERALRALQNLGAQLNRHGALDFTKAEFGDDDLVHLAVIAHAPEIPIRSLNFHGTNISDKGLVHLRNLTSLEELHLTETAISDAGLAWLRRLVNLQSLFLRDTQITDAGLAHLEDMQDLKQLRLQRTRVTDAGLARLAGLKNLQLLFLDETKVGDVGLRHLAGLSRMRHLYLNETKVTDAGLVHCRGMKELFALGLNKTQVRGAGLEHLVGLPIFERLYLAETPVNDQALVHIGKMTKISDLWLDNTQITDEGLLLLVPLGNVQAMGVKSPFVSKEGVQRYRKLSGNEREVRH